MHSIPTEKDRAELHVPDSIPALNGAGGDTDARQCWHSVELIVKDGRIQAWMDGTEIANVSRPAENDFYVHIPVVPGKS